MSENTSEHQMHKLVGLCCNCDDLGVEVGQHLKGELLSLN